jgi:hypothetical protein
MLGRLRAEDIWAIDPWLNSDNHLPVCLLGEVWRRENFPIQINKVILHI